MTVHDRRGVLRWARSRGTFFARSVVDTTPGVEHPKACATRSEGRVNRSKAQLFLIAFSVIGILTIIEGINDGWTVLNWIVLAVSIVFGAQAVLVLTKSGSPPS